jgi:transposase
VLGADRNEARSGGPINPRIHLFVRRGLSQGWLLHVSDHADFEHDMLPGLPRCAGTKVRPTGYPSRSRRRSQPSLRDLAVPENITLLYLPPYSPELNPKENLWDEIREKIFKNYALKSIDAVRAKLKEAIVYIERNPKLVQSITSFPYIVNSL